MSGDMPTAEEVIALRDRAHSYQPTMVGWAVIALLAKSGTREAILGALIALRAYADRLECGEYRSEDRP